MPKGVKPQISGKRKIRTMRAGEPMDIRMVGFQGDEFLQSAEYNTCCGCGLRHLIVYELRKHDGEFVLTIRRWEGK